LFRYLNNRNLSKSWYVNKASFISANRSFMVDHYSSFFHYPLMFKKQSKPGKTPWKRVLLLLGWYASTIHEGIVAYARQANWLLDLQVMRTGKLLADTPVDGIICLLGGYGSRPEFIEFVRKAKVPAVDLHADMAHVIDIPRVFFDNDAMGCMAAKYFIDRGYSSFAFCCQDMDDNSARLRYEGFNNTIKKHGQDVTLLEFPKHNRQKQHAKGWRRSDWLASKLRQLSTPLAVFATNDDTALIALDACTSACLSVPEQVAVMGCGNETVVCDFAPVSLSSVIVDFTKRSRLACELLDRLMTGKRAPCSPIILPPLGVEERRSTDMIAVANPHVSKAINFIRENYHRSDITLPLIAESTGLSLNRLMALFRRHLGRTIGEELQAIRLSRAQAMAKTGEYSATGIATACGFSSLLHFRRTLRRAMNINPRTWLRRIKDNPHQPRHETK
jgi:LacI family transcriptional regulator